MIISSPQQFLTAWHQNMHTCPSTIKRLALALCYLTNAFESHIQHTARRLGGARWRFAQRKQSFRRSNNPVTAPVSNFELWVTS